MVQPHYHQNWHVFAAIARAGPDSNALLNSTIDQENFPLLIQRRCPDA